jgi:DDE superfamily endonuclease
MRHRRHHQCRVCPHHTQKNALQPWQLQPWVISPQANADFGCAMEDVLAVYTRPNDPKRPQVCVDETRQQLVAKTCVPIPAAPGRPARVDDEYERQGTAHLLRVFEPLAGQRQVKVTARRTAVDFAHLLRELVDAQYPQAEKLVLVMDHLNTHKPASLYEAFVPAEARRILE